MGTYRQCGCPNGAYPWGGARSGRRIFAPAVFVCVAWGRSEWGDFISIGSA